MKDPTREQRWILQMVQAHNFARKDQHADAVARSAAVRDEVSRAVAEASDPAERARFERVLMRVTRQHAQHLEAFQAWRGAIEARRMEYIRQAPDEMARPLPNPPPPR
jgi:hypothetical protein